jgi:hypothetical protein
MTNLKVKFDCFQIYPTMHQKISKIRNLSIVINNFGIFHSIKETTHIWYHIKNLIFGPLKDSLP